MQLLLPVYHVTFILSQMMQISARFAQQLKFTLKVTPCTKKLTKRELKLHVFTHFLYTTRGLLGKSNMPVHIFTLFIYMQTEITAKKSID